MIKIEHVVLPSPEQMNFVIEGMRNPMNSWGLSDSYISVIEDPETLEQADFAFLLGDKDEDLMTRLSKAGPEHRKYLRMMPVMIRVTAPLYWWKEMDTYKFVVRNSCSTMHKIASKEFALDDFSCEHIMNEYGGSQWLSGFEDLVMNGLNSAREKFLETNNKKYWWQMIQTLPSSYNQTANLYLNYEVLHSIYHQRKNHKLDEWRVFCEWIEKLPYNELITGDAK